MLTRKLLLFVLAIAMVISCSDRDDEITVGTGLEGLNSFSIESINDIVILNSVDTAAEVIISWNPAESGLESLVSYTWYAYEQGENIADALLVLPSDNDGTATTITFTNIALDNILAEAGLEPGDELSLNWTVSATNGDVLKFAEPSVVTLRRFEDAIAPFSLLSPADDSLVELDFDNPDAPIVIEWDSTFSGFGSDITYEWLADAEGGDFSNPLLSIMSDNMGTYAQITFTNQDLEDVLTAQGVDVAGYLTLDWKVVASTTDLMLESIETFSVQLRRFNPVASKFLVGAATPGGWSWDAPTEILEVEEGVFQGTLAFNNDAFRVFDVRDDWGSGTNFPFYEGEGYTIDSRFVNAMDGDQNFSFIGTPGTYTFTLDTNAKAIRLTVGDPIFMVGAATPGGWSWDAPTFMYQIESGVWQTTIVFGNDAFRFFTTNGDWGSGRNFPFYADDGYTIDANFTNAMDGDQNFSFIGTPGEYTITLDENNKTIELTN